MIRQEGAHDELYAIPQLNDAVQEPVHCTYDNHCGTVVYDGCFTFGYWSVSDGCFAVGSCDWSIRYQPRPTRGNMDIRVSYRRTDGWYQGRSLRSQSKRSYYSLC